MKLILTFFVLFVLSACYVSANEGLSNADMQLLSQGECLDNIQLIKACCVGRNGIVQVMVPIDGTGVLEVRVMPEHFKRDVCEAIQRQMLLLREA